MDTTFNDFTAGLFRECAGLLTDQEANPFRARAYGRAADTLESLDTDVRQILRSDGIDGLLRLPGIGEGLASAIEEVARTGRLSQLDRLQGDSSAEAIFRTVPGIGETLARTIHEALDIETLEQLEVAANDGRLEEVPGVGKRRAAGIRAGVAAILRRRSGRRRDSWLPAASTLLAVDREYRRRAAAGELRMIAPRRMNPDRKAWLPILHTTRDGLHFTALYSNTARAHELGKTRDWVVIYYHDDDHREGQCTVVTETVGPLRDERVIRGREAECQRLKTG